MRTLGASRVQLSAISSEALWEQSGRLSKIGSELFRLTDRKEGRYLLAPTHEEEITTLVARSVKSYKNLPLRLYQITQKYRDELRPRHGLLRGREFIMKDMYTFDYSAEAALETYEQVREAYSQIFIKEMKLPILVAQASSGDMGGNLSHEYHIPTSLGEDHVINCNSCGYVANEELAESRLPQGEADMAAVELKAWRGISKDRKTLVNVWYDANQASEEQISTHAVKQVFPELDSGLEDPKPFWDAEVIRSSTTAEAPIRVINLLDCRLPKTELVRRIQDRLIGMPPGYEALDQDSSRTFTQNLSLPADLNPQEETVNFLRIKDDDPCPRCDDGTLKVQKAIELGHTFHLGTRYSEPLNAIVTVPSRLLSTTTTKAGEKPANGEQTVPIQMGCHGIGISRIMGAVADHLADERGLNWPRVIAPYDVVLVYNSKDKGLERDAETLYDSLTADVFKSPPLDAIIDDRADNSLGWKLKDADLVGYPVIVVLGREWKTSGRLEVQCRRLGYKEFVDSYSLKSCVTDLVNQL
ncbi:Proline--tRNA ligase [Cytospora mali]|uniref:proline--tRNA ligase n=1 Tax=Cytospora mali TaxID=578113 RepID=A0A194V934_CYTMA|nr:Proline--tRNA ligase [Valsa mali var. pyri (nom. inval.)]